MTTPFRKRPRGRCSTPSRWTRRGAFFPVPLVGEACTHVQGLRLKVQAVIPEWLVNSPIREPGRKSVDALSNHHRRCRGWIAFPRVADLPHDHAPRRPERCMATGAADLAPPRAERRLAIWRVARHATLDRFQLGIPSHDVRRTVRLSRTLRLVAVKAQPHRRRELPRVSSSIVPRGRRPSAGRQRSST